MRGNFRKSFLVLLLCALVLTELNAQSVGDILWNQDEDLRYEVTSPSTVTLVGCGWGDIIVPEVFQYYAPKEDGTMEHVGDFTVTAITKDVFHANQMITSIVLPNTVTDMGDWNTFADCQRLKSIKLPENISKIPNAAFSGCYELEDFELPNSITTIGEGAFNYCKSLTKIVLPPSVTNFPIRGAFQGVSAEIVLPSSITSIPKNFYQGYLGESVELPLQIEVIGDGAFSGCLSKSITLNDGVKKIGIFAFSGCDSIKTMSLPESLEEVDKTSFNQLKSLVELRAECQHIDGFEGCESLTKLIMGDQVKSVTGFKDCVKLEDVVWGNSLEEIGYFAFEGCTSLKQIILPSANNIGISAFSGCISIETIEADSLKFIDGFAFYGCEKLKSMTFPLLENIGRSAFEGCSSLESITFPDSVASISANSFRDCVGIKTISLPSHLKRLIHGAFEGCYNIQEVNAKMENPLVMEYFDKADYYTQAGVFEQSVIQNATLHIPYGCMDVYKSDSISYNRYGSTSYISNFWKDFHSIEEAGPLSIKSANIDKAYSFDVYALNGMLIRKGCTSRDMLANGIYIINGRKVTVRNRHISIHSQD